MAPFAVSSGISLDSKEEKIATKDSPAAAGLHGCHDGDVRRDDVERIWDLRGE